MRELELTDRRGSSDGFVGAEIPEDGGNFSTLVLVPDPGRYEDVLGRVDQTLLDEIDTTFGTGRTSCCSRSGTTPTRWTFCRGSTRCRSRRVLPAISADASLGAAGHAADITVDEYGTVAAAAAGLGFVDPLTGWCQRWRDLLIVGSEHF
jgi:hypothetical protein